MLARATSLILGLAFDLEADFQGDLEFCDLAIHDSAALSNDFEPIHVTNDLGCFDDCGFSCLGVKTLEESDFSQASQISAAKIRELAEGGYIWPR